MYIKKLYFYFENFQRLHICIKQRKSLSGLICKMSERQLCRLHGVEAISKCLFHGEPMCDECKYDKRHKDWPKGTVPVCAGISAEDLHRKEAHNVCCEIYTTALNIRNGNLSHDNDQSAKEVKSNLCLVLKEMKSKVDVLLETSQASLTKPTRDVSSRLVMYKMIQIVFWQK